MISLTRRLRLGLSNRRRGPPAGPSAPTGMFLSNDTTVAGSTGVIGHLFGIGGTAPYTFALLEGSSAALSIDGNALIPDGTQTEGELTAIVEVTDANDLAAEDTFTITVAAEAGENPVDPGDGDIEVPDPDDPGNDDDGFEDTPIEQNTKDGLKITGKNNGSAVFLRPLTLPGPGGSITYRHTFDGSAMTRGGSEAAFGLMIRDVNTVHVTTLRGDGNQAVTTMLASRITGDFRKANQFVKTDDGAAPDTTKAGPNYARLVRAADGETYSFYAGDDVEALNLIQEDRAVEMEGKEIGFAGIFTGQDRGVFQYTITVLELVDVPAQFGPGDWSAADAGTGGAITITVTTPPDDGGSALTDLEIQIDGGAWVSLGDTAPGDYPVSGLTDGVEVDVAIRAVNAIGNGTASATKAVTPTQAVTRRIVVVNFLESASTGIQEITTAALDGLTPKGAILIYGNIQSNKGNQTAAAYWSIGVADGTSQWGCCALDRDNTLNEDTFRGVNTTWMAQRFTVAGAVVARAAFDSFVTNGIRLNWSAVTGVELLSTVILFAGDDVTVDAGVVTGLSASPGANINVGFQPAAVMFAGVQSIGVTNSDANAFRTPLGWAVDAGEGAVSQQAINAARGASGDAEALRWTPDHCQTHIAGDGTINREIDVTAFDSTGFDIESSGAAAGMTVPYFAIKITGASFFAGHDIAKTTTGTQAKTGVGFEPDFGLFISQRGATEASQTVTSEMSMGIHAVGSDLTHGGASFTSNSSGTVKANSTNSNTSIVQQESDGVIDIDCTVQSWDADGYTFDFTNAATGVYAMPVLLIGGLN
jgi:hypothetical protein